MNIIKSGAEFDDVVFADIKPNEPAGNGFADLIITDSSEKPWLVIETKMLYKGEVKEQFDPYSPTVIRQAAKYAIDKGTPYFATTNGEDFVLFKTFEKFVPLGEREQRHYNLSTINLENFSKQLLHDLVKIERGVEKWSDVDNAFVARLKTLHNFIMPPYLDALNKIIDKNKDFSQNYSAWLKEASCNKSKSVK